MTLMMITIAGAVGCVVRFLLEYGVGRKPGLRPWGTVGANALGCFVAGLVAYGLATTLSPQWRDIVLTGFCGGLTTFSSAFAVPALLMKTATKSAVALVVTTPLACALAFAAGSFWPH